MTLEIVKMIVSDLEARADFPEILKEYGEECSIRGMPPIVEKIAGYKAIEATNFFQLFCALHDGKLIGLVTVITPIIPHYGAVVAVAESLFVAKAYRKTGAGNRLLITAQKHARERQSTGILFSAPIGGPLEKILPYYGFRATNKTFFKAF